MSAQDGMLSLLQLRFRSATRQLVQDPDKVNQFKHRMNTLAYGEAMMAAARDYGEVRAHEQDGCLASARTFACGKRCKWLIKCR